MGLAERSGDRREVTESTASARAWSLQPILEDPAGQAQGVRGRVSWMSLLTLQDLLLFFICSSCGPFCPQLSKGQAF